MQKDSENINRDASPVSGLTAKQSGSNTERDPRPKQDDSLGEIQRAGAQAANRDRQESVFCIEWTGRRFCHHVFCLSEGKNITSGSVGRLVNNATYDERPAATCHEWGCHLTRKR